MAVWGWKDLEIWIQQKVRLVQNAVLRRYMQCQTFDKALKAGDNLEFKQGNHTAGVFTVTLMQIYIMHFFLMAKMFDRFASMLPSPF